MHAATRHFPCPFSHTLFLGTFVVIGIWLLAVCIARWIDWPVGALIALPSIANTKLMGYNHKGILTLCMQVKKHDKMSPPPSTLADDNFRIVHHSFPR